MADEANPYDLQPASPFDAAASYGIHGHATQDLNQASNASEARLEQGVQSMQVTDAVAASGSDQKANEVAAAHFAQRAHAAVTNGIPPSELPADPHLSAAAQAEIYEAVAQQAGTSSHAIEQAAQERAAQTMAALQGGLGTLLGVATGSAAAETAEKKEAGNGYGKLVLNDHERGLGEDGRPLSTTATLAALEQFRPEAGLPMPQRQRGISQGIA